MASSPGRSYVRQRTQLVHLLRDEGITDERVLSAIGSVHRHRFVDQALRLRAYDNVALPIGLKQTISQPYTVAYQSQLLAPQKDEKILEIGTGSGYQAAVLCEMGARVFSVERHEGLADRADRLLKELGYTVRIRRGDGTIGWPGMDPFDGIIVTAGAFERPVALMEQLRIPDAARPGGRLIIPIGDRKSQTMMRCIRVGQEEYTWESTGQFRFVPFVSGKPPTKSQ